MRVSMCAGIALLVSTPVFAQDEIARKQAVELAAARVPFEKAMKGAPYSADTIVESSQTLADGNRISRKTTGQVYRDGEGRTRREEDVTITARTANGPVSNVRKTISIVDPVAGFSYSLDPERKIAWKTTIGGANTILDKLGAMDEYKATLDKMTAEMKARSEGSHDEQSAKAVPPTPTGGAGGGARGGGAGAGGGGGRGGAVMSAGAGGRGGGGMRGYAMAENNTPLEHKTIEGVAVEGRKTTTVIPAGEVGNEQPITITSEEWRSTELGLLVLTRHSDPRTGESSYRLQNIVRAEPDHSLFIVPPDYTVRDTGIRRVEPSRH